jgi:hypothetical protein
MGSPSSALTIGLGSWGSVNELVTLGFGSSSVTIVPGPFRATTGQMYSPGSESGQAHSPGGVIGQAYSPGSEAGQIA